MGDHSRSTNSLRNNPVEQLEARTVRSVNPITASIADAMMSAPDTTELQIASTASRISASTQTIETQSVSSLESSYGLSGYGQTVAIIDTGIAWDHRALGSGLGSNYRVVGGWDFAENDANPYDDGSKGGHGTHVAGIVGSTDLTYRGVAPGADLVGLRVFDDNGNGSFQWIESALAWVHQHRFDYEFPITTVNISIGANWNDANSTPGWSMLEDEFAQLNADGIFVAVSAGNSFTSYNASGLSYPASSPYVVPVASVGGSSLASYSQRADRVLAAPGQSVMSTYPDARANRDGIANDFRLMSGTSMASPHVAGASAVLREAMLLAGRTDVDQDDLYFAFRDTADLVYDSVTKANYHRINLDRAIEQILPEDEAGGISNPNRLGSLQQQTTIDGMLNSLSDQDYYSFVPTTSGKAQLRYHWLGHNGDQAKFTWNGRVVGEGYSETSLVAGQTYTFGLSQQQAIGRFQLIVTMQSPAVTVPPVNNNPTPPTDSTPAPPTKTPPASDVPAQNPSNGVSRPPSAPSASPISRAETYLTWTPSQSGYFRVDLDLAGTELADSVILSRQDGKEIARFSDGVGDRQFYMAGVAGQRYELQVSSRLPLSFSFNVGQDHFTGAALTNIFSYSTTSFQRTLAPSHVAQAAGTANAEINLDEALTTAPKRQSFVTSGVDSNAFANHTDPMAHRTLSHSPVVDQALDAGFASALDAIDRAIASIHGDDHLVRTSYAASITDVDNNESYDRSLESVWKNVDGLLDVPR